METTTDSDTNDTARLEVGRVYRGKRPKGCGFPPLCDDRQIKWISVLGDVQYDSPSVKNGRRYPTVSREKFLKWMSGDVTDELPDNGDWADFPLEPKAPAVGKYSYNCTFDGWRVDTGTVEAGSTNEAKKAVRAKYKSPRKVTGIQVGRVS